MTQGVDSRDGIVDYLRREIIGPDPVAPNIQSNGEEILTVDPPRLRYGAGILFPQAASADAVEDGGEEAATADEADADETEVPGYTDTDLPEPKADEEGGGVETSDAMTATDEAASAANAYLPSALGLSSLVAVPRDGLTVHVAAGQYRVVKVSHTNEKTGREYKHDNHYRTPLKFTTNLTADVLRGDGVVSGRVPVPPADGCPAGLEIHYLSRPRPDAGDCRLLTVSLINTIKGGNTVKNEHCFFQVELRVEGADGSACFVDYPDHDGRALDEEEEEAALLYRHKKTFAVGHGCAADWQEAGSARATSIFSVMLPEYEIKPIMPLVLSDLTLSMHALSDLGDVRAVVPLLTALCDKYDAWIEKQVQDAAQLSPRHAGAAERNIAKCRLCSERMRDGLLLLTTNSQAMQAFRLMNRTMLEQQLHYSLGLREWTREGKGPATIAPVVWPDLDAPKGNKGTWRPFQAAFILLGLRSLTEPAEASEWDAFEKERAYVDLIWFPTGGGKTEAYLGLTAYAVLLRRLRKPSDGGTTVLMRYTLRLLTAQQFQRAASLICALELMRRGDAMHFGATPITIGLWVGSLTPNKRADALSALRDMKTDTRADNPFVLLKCPWCGAEMGAKSFGQKTATLYGYEQANGPATVKFLCPDAVCPFSTPPGLPACVIDEDLYGRPPTLLIGTVDKFAMLPWRPEARTFFGLHDQSLSPPALIIQDELHLISGPLGSMVGHYETVIQELCSRTINGHVMRPKIVASTATISRAAEQCEALYGCGKADVFQFPPQCLEAGESFFAYEDRAAFGRRYVGVMAPALSSFVTAQVRVMSSLLQAPLSVIADPAARDPYWTLVAYFNNLRVLGHAVTLLGANIPEYWSASRKRVGLSAPKPGEPDLRRRIYRHIELTSRESSAWVTTSLQDLGRQYGSQPIDVCLATNMISVGLDVPRLGLMAVVGQPKTTSEYIQATSRVGREREKPGLVVTLYHPSKPRDRSHYERFRSYHQSIYRQVEPTSVTPFAAPVRDRALHALLTALVRHLGTPSNRSNPQPMPSATLLGRVRSIIEQRVATVDGNEREKTLALLNSKISKWENYLPAVYGEPGGPASEQPPLLYPAGSKASPDWEMNAWPTPTSMRDVDAECEAQVIGEYPR